MRKSIRKSTLALKIVPVLAGSAFKNKGIQPLLDAVVDYLPSPVDVPPVEGMNPENDEASCAWPGTISPLRPWRSKSCLTHSSGM